MEPIKWKIQNAGIGFLPNIAYCFTIKKSM